MFPRRSHIDTAIAMAAQMFCEDPVAVRNGTKIGSRARMLAFVALSTAFPAAPKETIALACGYALLPHPCPSVGPGTAPQWWQEIDVDEIVGALVAEQYGAQAA